MASKRNSKSAQKRPAKKTKSTPSKKGRIVKLRQWFGRLGARRKDFFSRRPHRSFRRTRRRDYKRSLKLPGYWSLTKQVVELITKNKRLLLGLALLYAVLILLLSSIMSQETYLQMRQLVDEPNESGLLDAGVANLALFWGVLSSQLSGGAVGTSQQIFGVLLGLYAWLAAVWLLRGLMAGKKPRIRDGVYSSGGPVIALAVLVLVLLIQLLPAALAVIAYGAADTSGLLDQTAVLMLFGGGAILLSTLSLYWITSTFIAMVIVTLPGMYPFEALKLAGDIAVGRRIRILLRWVWAIMLLIVTWAIVLIPIIILDGALKVAVPGLEWLPVVPVVALLLMSFSIVFFASYVYSFYRKVVEDDASPA